MVITEQAFKEQLDAKLSIFKGFLPDYVTGVGRAGAVAAAYASAYLGVRFLPFGWKCSNKKLLLLSAVSKTGDTLDKAAEQMAKKAGFVEAIALYQQSENLTFWFEEF